MAGFDEFSDTEAPVQQTVGAKAGAESDLGFITGSSRGGANAPTLAEEPGLAATHAGPPDGPSLSASPHAGELIGPFRIVRELGQGGMGQVFEAEQTAPVRRRVALKVIKMGMDTQAVVARFQAERQALAVMEHPYVAKVFEAGATPKGRPYFAMELVEGLSITDHCDQHALGLRERLELFLRVCDGVQHAHRKGIIHRDLKPSNVLVSIRDNEAVPKIIDFGVAKAITQQPGETLKTEHGAIIGTPAYMSPEQSGLSGASVDTRADVYSLGVILYEMLVGELPLELGGIGLEEVLDRVRNQCPLPPSVRLRGCATPSAISRKVGGLDTPTLARRLQRDLDWIALKALEKEPDRRYGSPQEMIDDIRRYLNNDAVLARPPSFTYHLHKFVRRNRMVVALATAAFILLSGFSVAMTVQAQRLEEQRDLARRQRERADLEAESARHVADFMQGLFRAADPDEAKGKSLTARELLDRGLEEIEGLAEQPALQVRLLQAMGLSYGGLGVFEKAEPLLTRVLETQERRLGIDHLETATAADNLADLRVSKGQLGQAESLYLQALDVYRRIRGPEDPETLKILADLAVVYDGQGRYEDSLQLNLKILKSNVAAYGKDHPTTLNRLNNLGVVYYNKKNYAEAERAYTEVLARRNQVLGSDHPRTLSTMNNLGLLYADQGKFDSARALYESALTKKRRVLGDTHPDTLRSMNNLAELHAKQGNHAEAAVLMEETLVGKTRTLGPDHPSTGITAHNLACLRRDMGALEPARRLFDRAQRIFEKQLGATHPFVVENLTQMAKLLKKSGDETKAAELNARAAAIRTQTE